MKTENDIFQIEGKVMSDPWMVSPKESMRLFKLPKLQREAIMKLPAEERAIKLRELFPD